MAAEPKVTNPLTKRKVTLSDGRLSNSVKDKLFAEMQKMWDDIKRWCKEMGRDEEYYTTDPFDEDYLTRVPDLPEDDTVEFVRYRYLKQDHSDVETAYATFIDHKNQNLPKVKDAIKAMREQCGSSMDAIVKALQGTNLSKQDIEESLRAGVADGTLERIPATWKCASGESKSASGE